MTAHTETRHATTTASRHRGRFAPTPSGPLHFGSLIAAVGSWAAARQAGGEWRLRIDDLDTPRCAPGAADAILRTLEAFGLEWDGSILWQTERLDCYEDALARLAAAGETYPCACTRKELFRTARTGPAGRIYPGTCRDGLPPGREGRSQRIRTDGHLIRFRDRLAGEQAMDLAHQVGDFLVRRGDGIYAYHLATVLDDKAQGVTDIVRGNDLLVPTACQIHLQERLGLPTPRYAHLPVVLGPDGRKLATHTGAEPLPEAANPDLLSAALRFLGHPPPQALEGAPCREQLDWLVSHWDWARIPAEDASTPQGNN